jgi:hypothetical protein
MVWMIDGPGDEDVDVAFAIRQTGQLRWHTEHLRKHRDRHTHYAAHGTPFDMVEHDELVEQLEPRRDRLNVQIEVTRVTDHWTVEGANIRRNEMPLEHLCHVEVGTNTCRDQCPDVGIGPVLNVFGMEADVQHAEGGILQVAQDVPGAATVPGQLRQHRDLVFRRQLDQTLGVRALATCQDGACTVIVSGDPRGDAAEKCCLRIREAR